MGRRFQSSKAGQSLDEKNVTIALYATATAVAVMGLSYAAVPLYQMFCQHYGIGGTTQVATAEQFKNVRPVKGAKPITVHFSASTSDSMPWTFRPQQKSVVVVPGETALAFYTAHNPSDKAVTGVSTYNVNPPRAGLYFHKIQCFCFEEQRLRPHEEIDMPVFFYIDPSALEDPGMDGVKSIVLSYTFFRTGDAEVLGLADEVRKQQGYGMLAPGAAPDDGTREKIRQWAEGMAQLTGVALPDNASGSGSGCEAASASGTASLSGNGSAGTVRG